MASIYSGSYITIAATASDSDTGGCFRKATNDRYGHGIEIYNDTDTIFTVRVRAQKQTHWMAIPRQMMCEDTCGDLGDDPPPLFTRAWCFQELLLSPRVIRFDEWEIAWCCRETERCSCGYLDRIAGPARNLDRTLQLFRTHRKEGKAIDSSQLWRSIIHYYCPLLLKYRRDTLPAISAVAKVFKENFGENDNYVAGLWQNSVIQDMLWFNAGEENKRSINRQEWLAPTWSWASCGGSPDYYFSPKHPLATVLDLHCEPTKAAPLVRFEPTAYIVLSGIAVSGVITMAKGGLQFALHDDTVDQDSWERVPNWVTMDIPSFEAAGKKFTIFRMAREEGYTMGEYWLILQATDRDDKAYERVGLTLIKLVPGAPTATWRDTVVKII